MSEQDLFMHDFPCDWTENGEQSRCGETPTAHAGDIYYACDEHLEDYRDFLNDD